MRIAVIAATVIAVVSVCSTSIAADPDPLQPLKMRSGTWIVKNTLKKALWTPEARTETVDEKIDWFLDKKFLRGSTAVRGSDRKGFWLANYDPQAKRYRMWFFDNQNAFPRGENAGRWNPKAKTMNWTVDFGDGVRGTADWMFPSADRFEWSMQARDRKGMLVLDMTGVATRKK